MTLNIALLNHDAIHVGADFRLTNGDTGELITDSSPKLIVLREQFSNARDWSGIATYCGVGRWLRRDTSDWLREWIEHEPSAHLDFENVVENVTHRGSDWLARLRTEAKYLGAHTFLVTALVRNEVKVAIISNRDRLHGPPYASNLPHLTAELMTVSTEKIVATGLTDAINDADYRALKNSVEAEKDSAEVQRHIAAVIDRASKSAASGGGISSSSFTYSIMRDGREAGYMHGAVSGPFNPFCSTKRD